LGGKLTTLEIENVKDFYLRNYITAVEEGLKVAG
jgi:hypothetical protein